MGVCVTTDEPAPLATTRRTHGPRGLVPVVTAGRDWLSGRARASHG